MSNKPRIVIYGVGQYGRFFTRFAAERGWQVVAAFNRAGPKVGRDLGQEAGLGRDLGVIIQDCETGDYEALRGKADIGMVAQTNVLSVNLPAYKRLMNAGLNVACHGSQSYFPFGCDPAIAAEIDAMGKKNNVTFMGGGIWDMSRIWSGILLAGPCTEIKSLHHDTITNACDGQVTPAQTIQIGVGMTVEQFNASGLTQAPPLKAYKTIPEHVLTALGYTISNTSVRIEPVLFDEPVESAFLGRAIPVGICAGTRIVAAIETKEGVTASANIELRVFKPGEIEHMFWSVEGKPVTRVRVERDDSAHATASNLFNRVPDIIAAKPGVVTCGQLGPMKHTAVM